MTETTQNKEQTKKEKLSILPYNQRKYIRIVHILEMLGDISRPTLFRIRRDDPTFPKGRKLSGRTTIWERQTVEKWIEDRDQSSFAFKKDQAKQG